MTLRPSGVRRAGDSAGPVREALRSPVGCPALSRAPAEPDASCPALSRAPAEPDASCPALAECARGAASAVVVISDHTRRTALPRLLPPVFDELRAAGMRPGAISLLVAYGNHLRTTDREIRRLTGRLPRGVRILHHDATDPGELAVIARLGSGEVVRLNRHAVEAEFLVITGAITFHYHAGFTGGPKALLPGIAARENILASHARTLAPGAPWGRHPRCAPGRLGGNPVHEAIEEVARAFAAKARRRPFLVNSVLAEDGSLAAVFAGDVFAAFARGAAYVDAHFARPIEAPFDLAIASAGGHPRDATLYQAHKAFDHASRAVRSGGVVVLAAACSRGAGTGFLDWFRHGSYEEHAEALQHRFAVPGQTALALRQKLGRVKGILVSRMPPEDVLATGLIPARRLGQGLRIARDLLEHEGGPQKTRRPRACLIPHAAVTLPRLVGK